MLAVMEDGITIPGKPDNYKHAGLRIIPNTTDAPSSTTEQELQRVAYNYAKQYNQLMISKIKSK